MPTGVTTAIDHDGPPRTGSGTIVTTDSPSSGSTRRASSRDQRSAPIVAAPHRRHQLGERRRRIVDRRQQPRRGRRQRPPVTVEHDDVQAALARQRAKERLRVDEQRQRAAPPGGSERRGEGAPPAAVRLGRHQRHRAGRARERLPRRFDQRPELARGGGVLVVDDGEHRRARAVDDHDRLIGMADVEQRAQARLHLVGAPLAHPSGGEVQVLEHVGELGLDGARAVADVDLLLRGELLDDARARLADEHRRQPDDPGERRQDAAEHDPRPPAHAAPACRKPWRFARVAWRFARFCVVWHSNAVRVHGTCRYNVTLS